MALFFFMLVFTIGLGLKIWLSTIDGSLSEQQKDLLETADWLVKTGIGTVGGLLLGKRLT